MAIRSAVQAPKGAADRKVLWFFLPILALSLLNAQAGLSRLVDGVTAQFSVFPLSKTARLHLRPPPSRSRSPSFA